MTLKRLAIVFGLLLLVTPLALVRPFSGGMTGPVERMGQDDQCPPAATGVGPLSAEVGMSAAFIRGGEVRTCTRGSRSAWSNAPVGPRTRFEAASLSKPVVAYAVLSLAEEGRLDLDAPLTRSGKTFTLRQALSHQAGFDNALSDSPAPRGVTGRFAYAGAGYIVAGQEIERATGLPLADYMNAVILPRLGMRDSSFGWAAQRSGDRAAPVADSGLVLALASLPAAIVGLAVCGLALAVPAWRRRARAPGWGAGVIGLVAAAPALVAPTMMFGKANAVAVTGFIALYGGVIVAGAVLGGRAFRPARLAALICLCLCALILTLRPGIPLRERNQRHLAPAGLITTATDYAIFLSTVGQEAEGPGVTMSNAVVEASADSDWGVGLGVQRAPEQAVWHWGVNFPGYQALAMRWPDGEVAVVLINGGALGWSPSGLRYSGLERAQVVVESFRGRRQGRLWRPIQ